MRAGCLFAALAAAAAHAAANASETPPGRVALSVEPATVTEGAAATWTLTATTESPPDSALALRVVSADETAAGPFDFGAIDRTVTWAPSDFRRQRESSRRASRFLAGRYRRAPPGAWGWSWRATATGSVQVADDLTVEEPETFEIAATFAAGGAGWALDPATVEVAIRDISTWGIRVVAVPGYLMEGQTREVAMAARIVLGDGSEPPQQACVVTFGMHIRLVTGGDASPGADYVLHGMPDRVRLPPCAPEVSWTARVSALADAEEDRGETLTVTPAPGSDARDDAAVLEPATLAIWNVRGGSD